MPGSAAGAASTPYQLLTSPDEAQGDGYGTALAVAKEQGDAKGAAAPSCGTAAPDASVGGVAGAGAVYEYVVSASGKPALSHTFTEASTMIGLTPDVGDHFGQVLSASADGGLSVGVPDRDVNGQKDAGVVVRIAGADDAARQPGGPGGQPGQPGGAGLGRGRRPVRCRR